MAFFPDVTRGDKFKPDALLSNNIRHIVNSMNGFSAKPLFATGGMIRIQVYNNTSSVIAAGTAVNFSENGSLCDDAVPAEPLKDAAKPWGVAVNPLKANAMGSCVLCGPANVALSGTGDYAEPGASNPATFTRGSTGDDIGKAFTAFTPEETIEKLDRLVILWDEAVELLRSGLFSFRTLHAEEELSNALAAGLLFRSSLHFVQAYRLKSSWTDASMKEWRRIACAERENLKKLLSVVESDPRIGYHIEAHEYLFTKKDVREKIQTLSHFLNLPSVSSNATTAFGPTFGLRAVPVSMEGNLPPETVSLCQKQRH